MVLNHLLLLLFPDVQCTVIIEPGVGDCSTTICATFQATHSSDWLGWPLPSSMLFQMEYSSAISVVDSPVLLFVTGYASATPNVTASSLRSRPTQLTH